MADDVGRPGTALPFGEIAGHYDQGRPDYPEALVDDVLDLSNLCGARIVEVGAGTGKATELFARRDLEILAIEPSPEMAAVARSQCAGFSQVSIVVSNFEDWPGEPQGFGLLISAQAWHWVAPEVRYSKAHKVLSPSGALALFWSHPLWEAAELGEPLAEIYEARAPELLGHGPWFPGFKGPHNAEKPSKSELAGYFGNVTERSYRRVLEYSAPEYLALVQSLPEHLAISVDRRALLLRGIAEAIESAGGLLRMEYETRLYFAIRAE